MISNQDGRFNQSSICKSFARYITHVKRKLLAWMDAEVHSPQALARYFPASTPLISVPVNR